MCYAHVPKINFAPNYLELPTKNMSVVFLETGIFSNLVTTELTRSPKKEFGAKKIAKVSLLRTTQINVRQ